MGAVTPPTSSGVAHGTSCEWLALAISAALARELGQGPEGIASLAALVAGARLRVVRAASWAGAARSGNASGRRGRSSSLSMLEIGRHARDRILAVGPAVGVGADQATIQVDRAAAHAGHRAGVIQERVRRLDQHQILIGAKLVQHVDDLDVEALGRRCLRRHSSRSPSCRPGSPRRAWS